MKRKQPIRIFAGIQLLLVILWGCSKTVVVPVPPVVELNRYGTIGVVAFSSNSEPAISIQATRRFQELIQSAQPGTPFIELGTRDAVLAAVGTRQLDVDAFRKIGEKFGVAAVFVGDLTYGEPRTDVSVSDLSRLEGGARTTIRADISSRLVETRSGASVWSASTWVTRQVGRIRVSAERGVSAKMNQSNSHAEMVPPLVYEITHDFRPTSVRQRVN